MLKKSRIIAPGGSILSFALAVAVLACLEFSNSAKAEVVPFTAPIPANVYGGSNCTGDFFSPNCNSNCDIYYALESSAMTICDPVFYPYIGFYYGGVLPAIYTVSGRPYLSYAYSPKIYVYRNNQWISLADANNVVCAGEQIKGELNKDTDIYAEWYSTGTWQGCPMAYFRDSFDWNSVPQCSGSDAIGSMIDACPGFVSAPTIFQTPATSISGNGFTCSGNTCTSPLVSGTYPLNFYIAATEAKQRYFANWCWTGYVCVNSGPEATASVPAWQQSQNIQVKTAAEDPVNCGTGECDETSGICDPDCSNQAPVVTVSFAKDPIVINEEVDVTCDIVDPNNCDDKNKITKVEWICTDSNGNSNNCSMWKEETGQFTQGGAVQNLVSSEQTNPFRATSKFKATQGGEYSVTCKATDNDTQNPGTGSGVNGVTVVGECGEDGVCNPNCNPPDPDCAHCGADGVCVQGCNPPDPDCAYGQVPAHSEYCAILPKGGESSDISKVCGTKGNAAFEAYPSTGSGKTYQWQCFEGDDVHETSAPSYTCSYDHQGTFTPLLTIISKDGTPSVCETKTKTTVTDESSCQVVLKKAGTSDDPADQITIAPQDQVVATIDRECLNGGTTEWTVTSGGTIISKNNNTATIKFDVSASTAQVKATVTRPDGQTIDCGGVGGARNTTKPNVEIKEKVQIGI